MDLNRVEVSWVRGIVWDAPVLLVEIIFYRVHLQVAAAMQHKQYVALLALISILAITMNRLADVNLQLMLQQTNLLLAAGDEDEP